MSLGIPRFLASRFAVPAGMMATAGHVAAECVETALDHTVAAPDEQQVRARFQRFLHLLRCLPALRDLVPQGIRDPFLGEHAAELHQPSTQRLPGVCEHGDRCHAWISISRANARSVDRSLGPETGVGNGGAYRQDREEDRADPEHDAGEDIDRVVEPSIHARDAHAGHDRHRDRPRRDPDGEVAGAR